MTFQRLRGYERGMKFVFKDPGETSENSSGGGTGGFLKEVVVMILAYWLMVLTIIAMAAFALIVLSKLIEVEW